uniref:Uncharacterized protein n=1 Tax=Cannabis sativa TaxID=3483 RepID=A0A803NHU2_CANSA
MDDLRSAMEDHMDQMADLVQKLSAELRTGLRPAYDNFIGTLAYGLTRIPFFAAAHYYYFKEKSQFSNDSLSSVIAGYKILNLVDDKAKVDGCFSDDILII